MPQGKKGICIGSGKLSDSWNKRGRKTNSIPEMQYTIVHTGPTDKEGVSIYYYAEKIEDGFDHARYPNVTSIFNLGRVR